MQFFKIAGKIVISAKNEQKDLLKTEWKTDSWELPKIESKPLVLTLYYRFKYE
jgi:hypothetical protein